MPVRGKGRKGNLDWRYVFRLRAFGALSYGKLHLLAFCQGAETARVDGTAVHAALKDPISDEIAR